MTTTSLFVIANVKQLRVKVVLGFYCLFPPTSRGVGVQNSAVFNSFQIGLSLADFGGPSEFRGGVEPPPPNRPPLYATGQWQEKCCQAATPTHSMSSTDRSLCFADVGEERRNIKLINVS